MVSGILNKIFGSKNDRIIKKLLKRVASINQLEPEFEQLNDADLAARSQQLKQRVADGESLDAVLNEAFALVRESSKRVYGMRHFDVQLVGGMILHDGNISEMRTGEGKTLTATLPTYLNALTGRGVHVITVNDYLAKRDAMWASQLFEFLGMTVGCNVPGMSPEQKREAYACNVTYGTNNEFGFDYLRDNMAFSLADRVQTDLYYAVVDEVDSVLIDEARTPLIISGQAEDSSELYLKMNTVIPKLTLQEQEDTEEQVGDGHYTIDEKGKQVHLTETGQIYVEEVLVQEGLLSPEESLFSANNISLLHHVNAALRAHTLFTKDVDYIVKEQQIVIVDEHTGRTMEGRRWSEGLHQAVEAKEGVPIQNENQTLASITFQNYFRLYDKLSGMTGTADTEAFEFQHIYGLDTVIVPTNKPMLRDDRADLIYMTADEKYEAIVGDIRDCVKREQPVLVGTVSIETSELLSRILTKEKIKHKVLNAKFHAQEAEIVAQAGRPGAVTIATNMAGRGTDIVLGGNPEVEIETLAQPSEEQIATVRKQWSERHEKVIAAGGLHIIGTERHESRRIDNQLRGRSGRQGDPGSSRFYLSLDDSLMRIFASERMGSMMKRLGMERGEAIEHPWVNKAIANAQRKVEGRNFDIRKQLLEYDDVANEQRKVIYEQRNDLLSTEDIGETIKAIRGDVISSTLDEYVPPQSLEEMWDIPGLEERLRGDFSIELPINQWLEQDDSLHEETLREKILAAVEQAYEEKEQAVGEQVLRQFEKAIMLQSLDNHWKEHLAAMDYLRQGIHLRGYAQKNPKQEYKRESFELFTGMLENLKRDVVSVLCRVKVQAQEDVDAVEQKRREEAERLKQTQTASASADAGAQQAEASQSSQPKAAAPQVRQGPKVGRNEPCPCGSGKKYKQCCGKLA